MQIEATALDTAWLLVTAALVFLMQAGFCALEAGFVRSRNTINVTAKNLIDFCIAGLVFWLFGFGLMFGESDYAEGLHAGWPAAFFLFQLMFCGTAMTLVSGAVAERVRFNGYALLAVIVSGLVYPVAGGWAWAGLDGGPAGWLAELGFLDFAGSTVVHSVGGWVALAAVLVIGPRHGRFEKGAEMAQPHSLPLAGIGLLFLWLGWIGFNGGSTLALTDATAGIIVATMLAACAGGSAATGLSMAVYGRTRIESLINGVLGGLVAITAGADLAGPGEAVVVGAAGGAVVIPATVLLNRLRIDDAVAAVPVHLGAGIVGTLAVAFLGSEEIFARSWLEQLQVQALGIVAVGAFAFTVSLVTLLIMSRFIRLKATAEEQQIGLNAVEHNAVSAAHQLALAMQEQFSHGTIGEAVEVETGSDVEIVARQYNRVVARVRSDTERLERNVQELEAAQDQAEQANRAKSLFLANMSHELRTPLNAIIGFSEIMANQSFGPMGNERYGEYAGDINDAGRHLLSLVNDMLDHTSIESGKVELNEREIDLADLAATVIRGLRPLAEQSRVTLSLDNAPGLPPLIGDERMVRQMTLNLVSNAIKFTDADGQVVVKPRLEPDGRLAIVVSDTGIGMTREEIEKAMEPFTQLQQDYNKTQGGTGLGLAIVKHLCKAMKARIEVRSRKGRGSTFRLRMREVPRELPARSS